MKMDKKRWFIGFIIPFILSFTAIQGARWLWNAGKNELAEQRIETLYASVNNKEVWNSPCGETATSNVASASFAEIKQTREAIRAGRFDEAQQLVQSVYERSQITCWHFVPFTPFLDKVTAVADEQFTQQLVNWVNDQPESMEARLVLAAFAYHYAWYVRGRGFSSTVHQDERMGFREWIEAAAYYNALVLEQVPKHPYALFLQLQISASTQSFNERYDTFEMLIQAAPQYVALYVSQLTYLLPRWGGSIASMHRFVEVFTQDLSPDSPMQILHVKLYVLLVKEAGTRCSNLSASKRQDCIVNKLQELDGDKVKPRMLEVLNHFVGRDNPEANREVAGYLRDMMRVRGSEKVTSELLEAFAQRLHSTTQLVSNEAFDNDYTVDQETAYYWRKQKSYDNALTLGRRALANVNNTNFVSEAAKMHVRLSIMNDMLASHFFKREYEAVLELGDQMAKLQGGFGANVENENLVCEAAYRLNRSELVIPIQSAMIAANDDAIARFFRARTYQNSKQYALAVDDFGEVIGAPVGYGYRVASAIEMALSFEHIEGKEAALDLMEQLEFVFTDDRAGDTDRAVFYNNRCYLKMELGDDQAALDDCNLSLKYDSLPDAISKKHQLERRNPLRKE